MGNTSCKRNIISIRTFTIVSLCSLTIAIVFFILLLLNREYNINWPFDSDIFGSYGDFIGGVIGTIVALYSAYLLICTLENQIAVNDNVIKTNNASIVASQLSGYQTQLQLFDNKFNCFMNRYIKAIDAYIYESNGTTFTGRKAFEEIAKTFISTQFDNNNDYSRRSDSATFEYIDFYSKNRTYMSVHFRLLYLLISLIGNSDLEEKDKVLYAKLVRGQMSDAEMLLIRYNCRSDYGRKMRDYCNAYNLVKHLSVMRLLEFQLYYNKLKEATAEMPPANLQELTGGLDAMFITLRKRATQLLYEECSAIDTYNIGRRYQIKLSTSSGGKKFLAEIHKNKAINRRGRGRKSATERALDCFSEELLEKLFRDFLTELFCISNFFRYNEGLKNIAKGNVKSNTNEYVCKYFISYTQRLALSEKQMKSRENNQQEIIDMEQ